jgi:hypothetical protein
MHNGSSIPCFGKKVGTISSSVSGGAAPYTYKWSNGETTSNITGIAAGFYSVDVKDANGTVEKAVITLTEPEPLCVFADPFVYPNGKNISCFECFNGSIDLQVEKGTPPYSYLWQDGGVTTQDRTGLGAKSYEVTVTDANGCVEKAAIALEQPESNDWKMGGNAGTNPATQYIGTSDNKDVVFKANGQESLRLLPNGDIKLTGSMAQGGVLFRREDGRIAPGDLQDWSETLNPADPGCVLLRGYPYWRSDGNTFENVCPEVDIKLGTLTPQPLRIVTNDQTRVFVSTDGNVGIGVATPLANCTCRVICSSTPRMDPLSVPTTTMMVSRYGRGTTMPPGVCPSILAAPVISSAT